MNKCGVYVIRCEPTGEEYVGASVNIVKRVREHFYRLERGVHRNHRLQNTYNKYGKDSFRSEVLLYCDPINLEMYGKQIMKELHPEFNIVNTENTKRTRMRLLRAAMKDYKKNNEWQARFFRKLEKQIARAQQRPHRL